MKNFASFLICMSLSFMNCSSNLNQDWYFDGEIVFLPPESTMANVFEITENSDKRYIVVGEPISDASKDFYIISAMDFDHLSLTLLLGSDSFAETDTLMSFVIGDNMKQICKVREAYGNVEMTEEEWRDFARHVPDLFSQLKTSKNSVLESFHMNVLEYESKGELVRDTLYGRHSILEMFTSRFCALPRIE